MGCSWFVGDNAAYLGRGCKRRGFAPGPTKGDGPWNTETLSFESLGPTRTYRRPGRPQGFKRQKNRIPKAAPLVGRKGPWGQSPGGVRGKAPPYGANAPATAPLMQVAIVPATMDRMPSPTISCRRSGTMAPRPPIMIPRLPKLANPHSA